MFCPVCRLEYRQGFTKCSDCNVELVDNLPLGREEGSVNYEEGLHTVRPKTKRVLLVSIAAIFIFILAMVFFKPVAYYPYLSEQIKQYHGDGVIEDISLRFIIFPTRGYSLILPKFDLSSTQNNSYTLSNLPVLDTETTLFFVIEDPSSSLQAKENISEGAVEIILSNSKHEQIIAIEQSLTDFRWSSPKGGIQGWALYDDRRRSSFNPVEGESYSLSINYKPDPKLAHLKGFILLRAGGELI